MRKHCFDCARKHLAQAIVISMELRYYAGDLEDDHLWICIGHLAEAADQIQKHSPYVADMIRQQRLLLMKEGASAVAKLTLNNLVHQITELAAEAAVQPNTLGLEIDTSDLMDLGVRIQHYSNGGSA